MDVSIMLTVFFEEPFWVGIYERVEDGQMTVSKITFGAEPRDYEVYEYMSVHWCRLQFSPPISEEKQEERKINPKRMQRAINKQMQNTGMGTKAQQALKLQHEQNKLKRKAVSKERKEQEKNRKFKLRQQKKKEKHKGK